MRRKWVIYAIMCALLPLLGVTVAVFWYKPGAPAVSLELVETRLGDWSQPVAVFRVTNAGRRAVVLNFDSFDRKSGSEWCPVFPRNVVMPLGIFGRCSVRPGTNSTVAILGPLHSGAWRVHAGVFLPLTTLPKVKIAAQSAWARLSGKSRVTSLWPPDGRQWAYEICSPEVPGLGPPPNLSAEFLLGLDGLQDAGPRVPDFHWWTNQALDRALPPWARRVAPPYATPPRR